MDDTLFEELHSYVSYVFTPTIEFCNADPNKSPYFGYRVTHFVGVNTCMRYVANSTQCVTLGGIFACEEYNGHVVISESKRNEQASYSLLNMRANDA